MYTGGVLSRRAFACVLALALLVKPVVAAVCQMDCDQLPKPAFCHESTGSPEGPGLRDAAGHPCDHDHTNGSPALVASANVRDLVGSLAGMFVQTATCMSMAVEHQTDAASHGPPGQDARRELVRITALRI